MSGFAQDVWAAWQAGRARGGRARDIAAAAAATAEVLAPLAAVAASLPDPEAIPPREWLYGTRLVRRFVSVLIAPGGVGKSALALGQAVALASGRPILGERVHHSVPVWVLNLEDPLDETQRRLAALMRLHAIPREALAGRLFLHSGRCRRVTMAELGDDSSVRHPDRDAIVAAALGAGIGLIVVDPFVKSHSIDENSNGQVDAAATAWAEVAEVTGAAVLLVHHVRKGAAADVEAARGAKALTDAARSAALLVPMTPEEAERLGVAPGDRWRHVRLDDAKANLAPRLGGGETALWYCLRTVALCNGTAAYPSGDHVAAIAPWYPLPVAEPPRRGRAPARVRVGHGPAPSWRDAARDGDALSGAPAGSRAPAGGYADGDGAAASDGHAVLDRVAAPAGAASGAYVARDGFAAPAGTAASGAYDSREGVAAPPDVAPLDDYGLRDDVPASNYDAAPDGRARRGRAASSDGYAPRSGVAAPAGYAHGDAAAAPTELARSDGSASRAGTAGPDRDAASDGHDRRDRTTPLDDHAPRNGFATPAGAASSGYAQVDAVAALADNIASDGHARRVWTGPADGYAPRSGAVARDHAAPGGHAHTIAAPGQVSPAHGYGSRNGAATSRADGAWRGYADRHGARTRGADAEAGSSLPPARIAALEPSRPDHAPDDLVPVAPEPAIHALNESAQDARRLGKLAGLGGHANRDGAAASDGDAAAGGASVALASEAQSGRRAPGQAEAPAWHASLPAIPALDPEAVRVALARIAAGPGDGLAWSLQRGGPPRRDSVDRWVGRVLVEACALTDAEAGSVALAWVRLGILAECPYRDPIQRKRRLGLRVRDAAQATA